MTAAPLGDEVDQFLEGALLARPVERPDLRVPGPAAGVGVGRVHDAEQVLQPELLAVLGVIPRPFNIEEQITNLCNGQRQEPPVAQELSRQVPFRFQNLVPDAALILAGHLQAGLQLGPGQGLLARSVTGGQDGQGRQAAPGRDPGGLQRPPLVPGDPGDQRQVVVAPPAGRAQVVPAADHAVLHRFGVGVGGRVVARVGGDERTQGAPGLPFVGRVIPDLERYQFAPAERQVHPAGPDALHRRQEMGVERGLRDRARLGGPGQLGVHHLVVRLSRARLPARVPVRRAEQAGPHQEVRPPQQRRPAVRALAQQHALVDDVGPAKDRLQRGPRRVGVRIRAGAYPHDGAPVRTEPLQHGQLVRLAAPDQVLETDVELPHPAQCSPRREQVQPGHVLARHKVSDVTRRQPQPFPSDLHPAPPCPPRRLPPGIFLHCAAPGMPFVDFGESLAGAGRGANGHWPVTPWRRRAAMNLLPPSCHRPDVPPRPLDEQTLMVNEAPGGEWAAE